MAYIFGFFLLGLLFVLLHYFTEISTQQKLGVVSVLSILILGAYLYNQASENRRIHLENVLLDFNHGKSIECNGIDVNSSGFSYSSGTQTFLGLKDTPMDGRIISLEQCR